MYLKIRFDKFTLLMKALDFPKGNYYSIICKAGDQALRIQESDPAKF
jgi:hypothetical protein